MNAARSRYLQFTRAEWAKLRADTPLTLDENDLARIRGLNESVALDEVVDIYLPLARLLDLHIGASQVLHRARHDSGARSTSQTWSRTSCRPAAARISSSRRDESRGSGAFVSASSDVVLLRVARSIDSSSLTAGAAGSADPRRRGATLAVHSMAGYAGGFVGPLVIGWVLDMSGGMSTMGWGLAFLHVAVVALIGQLGFIALRPRDLAGDRGRMTHHHGGVRPR